MKYEINERNKYHKSNLDILLGYQTSAADALHIKPVVLNPEFFVEQYHIVDAGCWGLDLKNAGVWRETDKHSFC